MGGFFSPRCKGPVKVFIRRPCGSVFPYCFTLWWFIRHKVISPQIVLESIVRIYYSVDDILRLSWKLIWPHMIWLWNGCLLFVTDLLWCRSLIITNYLVSLILLFVVFTSFILSIHYHFYQYFQQARSSILIFTHTLCTHSRKYRIWKTRSGFLYSITVILSRMISLLNINEWVWTTSINYTLH